MTATVQTRRKPKARIVAGCVAAAVVLACGLAAAPWPPRPGRRGSPGTLPGTPCWRIASGRC